MSTTTTPRPGKLGQALYFDNTNDYINAGSGTSLNLTGAMSVCLWVKANSFAVGGDPLVAQSNGDFSNVQFAVLFSDDVNGGPEFLWGQGGTYEDYYANTGLSLNRWYHICAIRISAADVDIYVNGSSVSVSATGNENVPTQQGNTLIGGAPAASAYFDGLMDDIRIYNRALSSAEIRALYGAGQAQMAVSASYQSGDPLTTGLVGHWTFDGPDMTPNVRDQSGQGNHGYLTGMSATTTRGGRLGQALLFDGLNDMLRVGGPTITNSHTVSFWMYVDALTSPSGWTHFIGEDHNTALQLEHSSRKLDFYYSTADHLSNTALALKRWHHIALVNNAGTVTFYVNGVADGTAASAPGYNVRYIGNNERSGGGEPLNGLMDDVRVYNRALSVAEVQKLVSAGTSLANASSRAGTVSSGLVGHWTFDGPRVNWTSGAVTDSSGNGNTGYVIGMSTSTSAVPGKLAQALLFDGSNDTVRAAGSGSLDNLTTLTVCAWVKPSTLVSDEYPVAVMKISDAVNAGWDLYLDNYGGNSGVLGFGTSFYGSTGQVDAKQMTTRAVPLGKWSHLCASQNGDGSANMALYFNGAVVTSTDVQDNATRASDSGVVIRFGGAAVTPSRFMGSIDDVRVYNKVLSASEIQQLYQLGR